MVIPVSSKPMVVLDPGLVVVDMLGTAFDGAVAVAD